ncbi:WLM domain-domain-containing protein [Kockovaella imperatae]|uniref:WLM domain-domain-containing protein n=1 Tax=Kockovaella imperatae TaxID=4999 RepID=A0A1Y1UD76_9TREE|nr:WLM domain-domain-containing protein [Kockovaella imperatae]ORX36008.1 WLM domain-domain-containing protein [Kockovaella imperatae]
MQAPGFRFNERESNPNHYVGFIRALKAEPDHTDAEMILKAVAAQMKKVMQHRYMFIHTLEEAAFNRVFAGRNWNHGQSVELVLRGPSGRFLPLPYIVSVMCHEMAHIEQMNHGPKFQKLMREIKQEVKEMQARGYYGDGFWSDGQRLKDSVRMGAEGLKPSDFPEYVCGVSASDAKKAKRRPPTGVSLTSGRQTDYNTKPARRNHADMGDNGTRLDGRREITKEDLDEKKRWIDDRAQEILTTGVSVKTARAKAGKEWAAQNPGNTRGKVAKSKTAAELRAAAAEARLAATSPDNPGGFEVPDPHLNPAQRRSQIEAEMDEDEKRQLRGGWEEFMQFDTPVKRHASPPVGARKRGRNAESTSWACAVCTYENGADQRRCDMCESLPVA